MINAKRIITMCITGALCLGSVSVNASAALGSVKATAGFGYTNPSTTKYIFYGNGKAIEQTASKANTTNIYAKVTVMRSDNTILATKDYTDHNVASVSVDCQTSSMAITSNKYYTTTTARARYKDNSVSQRAAKTTPKQFVTVSSVFSTENDGEINSKGYDFIPANAIEAKGNDVSYEDPSAIELIYGDHIIKAQVGDVLPFGVYLSKDNSRCYVIDKKADGTKIKTTYEIVGQQYSKVSEEII